MTSHELAKRLLNMADVPLVAKVGEDSRDNKVFGNIVDCFLTRVTEGGVPFVAVDLTTGNETFEEVA